MTRATLRAHRDRRRARAKKVLVARLASGGSLARRAARLALLTGFPLRSSGARGSVVPYEEARHRARRSRRSRPIRQRAADHSPSAREALGVCVPNTAHEGLGALRLRFWQTRQGCGDHRGAPIRGCCAAAVRAARRESGLSRASARTHAQGRALKGGGLAGISGGYPQLDAGRRRRRVRAAGGLLWTKTVFVHCRFWAALGGRGDIPAVRKLSRHNPSALDQSRHDICQPAAHTRRVLAGWPVARMGWAGAGALPSNGQPWR